MKVIPRNILTKRRRYFKSIKQEIQRKFKHRDEWKCHIEGCNCKNSLDIHHIIPLSQNGSNEMENLIPLCKEHHKGVHRDDWDVDLDGKELHY